MDTSPLTDRPTDLLVRDLEGVREGHDGPDRGGPIPHRYLLDVGARQVGLARDKAMRHGPKSFSDGHLFDVADRITSVNATGDALCAKPCADSNTSESLTPGAAGCYLLRVSSEPDDTTVGSRIRELRQARGLTLVEVAERVGTKHGPLSQYERGERNPSLPMLESIAAALGVSPAEFWLNREVFDEADDTGHERVHDDSAASDFDWIGFQRAIKRRRLELGLRQRGLADLIGVGQGFVSEIESGKKKPSLDVLVKLAAALETTPASLWSGLAGPPMPSDSAPLKRPMTVENIIHGMDYAVRGPTFLDGADDCREVDMATVPAGCRAIDLRVPLEVKVQGEPTMLLPAGYVLIIDSARQPQHADIVVAVQGQEAPDGSDDEATRPARAELRRYEEGPRGVPLLFHLDTDDADTLSQGWRVAGVVIEYRRPLVVDSGG